MKLSLSNKCLISGGGTLVTASILGQAWNVNPLLVTVVAGGVAATLVIGQIESAIEEAKRETQESRNFLTFLIRRSLFNDAETTCANRTHSERQKRARSPNGNLVRLPEWLNQTADTQEAILTAK